MNKSKILEILKRGMKKAKEYENNKKDEYAIEKAYGCLHGTCEFLINQLKIEGVK